MSEPLAPSPPPEQPVAVERQLHPLSWVFESVRNLRGAITAAFFIFFVQQGSVGPRFFLLFLAPFLFFSGIVGPLLRYLTFRYRLEEEELVLRRGVLSRNERRLAYSRVQNIDLVENPFHRAFGLALVKIETASGGKAEATMHLSPAAVEELRQRIFANRQSTEAPAPSVDGAPSSAAPSRKTLLKLDYGEIVRLGLIQNRGMVLVAAAFGLFFQQSFIDWETFGRWISRWAATADMPSVEASPAVLVAGAAFLVGVWLVLLALLSIAFALLRFAHFELSRDGEDLRARFGLLTRVAMTVPRRRVQRVWSTQTLLHRLFGRISIRLDTAGGGQDDGATGRHWLAPVGRPEVLSPLILEALPELDAEPLETWPERAGERWLPIVRRSWKRLFRRWTVLSALVLGVAAAITSHYWLLLAIVPLALLYGFIARRTIDSRYYALTEDAILTRSGWLSRTLSIVRFEKVQAVAFKQSPFDRRHGTDRFTSIRPARLSDQRSRWISSMPTTASDSPRCCIAKRRRAPSAGAEMASKQRTGPVYLSSASAMADAIARRELSSVELVEAHLERIDEVRSLNAVVQTDPESAIAQARRADDVVERGEATGPLHGVPVTIKDSLDTADFVTTGGTRGRQDQIPPTDATVVRRLRRAGAIVLGKTNTPELTLSFETVNEIYGMTYNPYDRSRSPGGSSGGAAAILAAGGSALDVGTDYGGSIRLPAHFCGIAGLKPTAGRVPRSGHAFPFGGVNDSFQQVGPMARFVEDLKLALPLLAGPDQVDPAIVPMPLGDPSATQIEDLRIGFFTSTELAPSTEPVRAATHAAARALESAGARVEEIEPAWFEEAFDVGSGLFRADGGAAVERLLAAAGTGDSDLLGGTSSPLDAHQLDELILRWYSVRSRISQELRDVDVVISPPNARTAPESGWALSPLALPAFSYTVLHNVTGWPSGVVRCGSDGKLPVGVQATAKPAEEHLVLAVLGHLEQVLGGYQPPEL